MHTVRFKTAVTLQDVMETVVDRRTADPSAAMKRVAELNAHIDFTKKKIPQETVLILPDEPGIKRGNKGTKGPESQSRSELGSVISSGFQAAEERVGKAVEAAGAERSDLLAAIKTAVAKRQMESDPELHQRLGDALAKADRRQKELAETAENIGRMRKAFAEEYKAMEKLFR